MFILPNVSELHQPRPKKPKAQDQTFTNNNHTSTADATATPLYSFKVHVLGKLSIFLAHHIERDRLHMCCTQLIISGAGAVQPARRETEDQRSEACEGEGGIH